MFNEDLGQFFSESDFAIEASFAGATGPVLFDSPDQIISDGQVHSAEYRITYPTGQFPGLAYDCEMTLTWRNDAGAVTRCETFVVSEPPSAIDDGALSVAALSKP